MPIIDEHKRVAAIDFDGVIHEFHQWTGEEATNSLIKGALEALTLLKDFNYNVVIFSTRPKIAIKEFLIKHKMEHLVDEIIDGKPFYHVFFDDRARHIYPNSDNELLLQVRNYLRSGGEIE